MQVNEIAQENFRAAKSRVADMTIANEMVNMLKGQILDEPEKSMSVYGNLRLSGRHIVWEATKH